MSAAAPTSVSGKVSNGSLVGAAVGFVTWAMVTYIPAWHSGLPPALSAVIPVAVAVIGHFVGGYAAKHQPTVTEVITALADAERIIDAARPVTLPMPPSAPPVVQTSTTGGAP